jgi:hypothetical protein
MRKSLLAVFPLLALLAPAAAYADDPCRVVENVRIDHALDTQGLADVCEITGALSIFADDDLTQVALPSLKHVNSISVEAYNLEALSLPALQDAGQLYLRGPKLSIVDLPALRSVSRFVDVKAPRLETLNLNALGFVSQLYIQNVPLLKFIFIENIYDIRELDVRGAPSLDPNVLARLKMAAGEPETPEQEEADRNADMAALQKQIHDLQQMLVLAQNPQQPLPPTGHPVEFGSIGGYYQNYSYYFYNYWNVLAARGLTGYYGPSMYYWWWVQG